MTDSGRPRLGVLLITLNEERLLEAVLESVKWADEIVTPELRDSILQAIQQPGQVAGFRMRLHTWFLGEWFGTRGWRTEWKPRLFRRDRGSFSDAPIHEGAIIHGPLGTLSGALLHYPYRDIDHFTEKMNRYSSAMALALRERGRTSSPDAAPKSMEEG